MYLNIFLQYLLPKHILSRLVAKIANCRLPLIKNFIINLYCKFYPIDMTDAIESNPLNYPTFNDFFTRPLKPDARPIAADPKTIISPVDGKIWQIGKTENNLLINAKGRGFTLEQLLADDKDAIQFHNGNFAVLYLAPYNYHRIHMPIQGKLHHMRYIPGNLFSVNPSVAQHIPDVFAKNERVVSIFDTIHGPMAIIMVGAIIVGSIETKWEGIITPNKQVAAVNTMTKTWDYSKQNLSFERGVEIGSFKLGSTVILLFPENTAKWLDGLQFNTPIKMGQKLGQYA